MGNNCANKDKYNLDEWTIQHVIINIKRDDRTTLCGIYNVGAIIIITDQNYDSSIIFEKTKISDQTCYRDLRRKRVSYWFLRRVTRL